MAPSTSSAATPAGRGKKRAAAAASDAASDPAAERFARRVALHLRDAAAAHDEPWDAASLRAGFADAVANLPDGALKQRLSADVDGFAARVVEKTTRPTADDEPAAGEFGGPDDDAFRLARRAPRRDFDAMTLAELAEETSARLVRASFDFPSWIGDTPEERDELETAREVNLEMIADAAEATAKSYAGNGKKTRATEEERRVVGEVLCRALAYAALRRHGRDEHGRGAPGRARTEAAAARLVIARQRFRGATAKADRDDTDARRDAAVACGDSRVALIRALAKEVPDDVDVRGIAQGAQEDAQEGGQGKKKGRKLVVGGFGARDLPLFEAALGLGGFDATFEAEMTSEGISTFADPNAPAVEGAPGPEILPPFVPDAALAAADAAAFAPDATLTQIAASYERALVGAVDAFGLAGDDDDDDDADEAAAAAADGAELRYVAAYVDFLKVLRGASALRVAGGDRRGAEDLARFAARAACPSLLLIHLGSAAMSADPRAASVELAAAAPDAWAAAIRAWGEAREMLSAAAPGGGEEDDEDGGGFFLDVAPGGEAEVRRAVDLADMLAKEAEGQDLAGDALTAEEEEELVEMLRKNRSYLGGGGDSDDDVLNHLSDEEEAIEEMRANAAR